MVNRAAVQAELAKEVKAMIAKARAEPPGSQLRTVWARAARITNRCLWRMRVSTQVLHAQIRARRQREGR